MVEVGGRGGAYERGGGDVEGVAVEWGTWRVRGVTGHIEREENKRGI